MNYNFIIPDETKFHFINKCFVWRYTNVEMKLLDCNFNNYYVALSSAIQIKPNDVIIASIPLDLEKEIYNKFGTRYALQEHSFIRLPLSRYRNFIDDDGNVNMSVAQKNYLSFTTTSGDVNVNTTLNILSYSNDYKKFENENILTMKINMNTYYDAGYRYVWLYTIIPKNYPLYKLPKELTNIYGSTIIRSGTDNEENWLNEQNKLAMKHYLYQTHIKKERK